MPNEFDGGGGGGTTGGIPPAGTPPAGSSGAPGGGAGALVVGPTPSAPQQVPGWLGTFIGRNDKLPAHLIGEFECDANQNVLIDRKTIKSRPGREKILDTLTATTWTPSGGTRVYGLRLGSPYDYVAGNFDGTNKIKTNRSGAWADLLSGYSTGTAGLVEFVAARQAIYVLFGSTTEIPRKVTGADVVANVPWTPAIKPSWGVFHKKRLFVNDVNNRGRIWLSDSDLPDTMRDQTSATIPTEGGWIDFVVPDGDNIVCMASFGQFLVIFSERSIHFLSGTSFANFSINSAFGFGTKSPRSVHLCENDLWFLDSNGTVRFISGSQPNINSIIATGVPGYYVEPLTQAILDAPAGASLSLDVYTVSYTGTGAAQTVAAAIPWAPNFVLIRCRDTVNTVAAGVWRLSTRDTGSNSMYVQESFNYTTLITAMSASGVVLGAADEVNKVGLLYDLVAFRTGTNFVMGSYVGNDAASQNVALGIVPEMVWVSGPGSVLTDTCMWTKFMGTTAGTALTLGIHDSSSQGGGTQGFNGNGSTTLEVRGVSSSPNGGNFNRLNVTYYYVAWGPAANVKLQDFTGSIVDNRVIPTVPVTTIKWAFLQGQNNDQGPNEKGSTMRIDGYDSTDVSGQIIAGVPSKPDFIQKLQSGSVELGASGNKANGHKNQLFVVGPAAVTGAIASVCAVYLDRRYWIFYPPTGGLRNTQALCWEFRELPIPGSKWCFHTALEAGAVWATGGQTDPDRLYYLDSASPVLRQFPKGLTDDGTAITWLWRSKAFDMGAPQWEKSISRLAAVFLGYTGSATLNFYEDLKTTVDTTFALTYSGGAFERQETKWIGSGLQGRLIAIELTGSTSTGAELTGLEIDPVRKRRS